MRHLESTLEKCLCIRALIYPPFEIYFFLVVIACLGYLCSVSLAISHAVIPIRSFLVFLADICSV